MMLVHKQPMLTLSQPHSPAFSHRRHPSAPPTVIVQPTRTPGLLSLSKPVHKSSPQRQLPSTQRSSQQKQSPRPRPGLLNTAEITDKKTAVRPPKPSQKQAKVQSDSPPRHGKHARQPSPPLPPPEPSQAEATNSDPFLDSFAPTTFKPTPVLTPRPSGKLANRRMPHQSPIPPLVVATPTKAIQVPVAPRRNTQHLSRSVPVVSHSWDHICDDSNDEDSSPPSTPLRPRFNNEGPRTAPLSARAPGTFPFYDVPSPSKRKLRNHKRAPSDHIFAMSSDDEALSGTEDLRALLNFARTGSRPSSASTPPPQRMVNPDYIRSLSPASREKFFELEAQKEVAGYFASSSFQNSPNPDDLPDPLFA